MGSLLLLQSELWSKLSPAQSKRAVVKTLINRAKCLPSSTEQRRNKEQRVKFVEKTCEKKESETRSEDLECTTVFSLIPYVKGVPERIRRILGQGNVETAFRPVKTLGDVFKKPKDRPLDTG